MFPVSKEAVERFSSEQWELLARSEFEKLGELAPVQIEQKVIERATIDGMVMPWTFEGYTLPDDAVMIHFTAYVVRKAEDE